MKSKENPAGRLEQLLKQFKKNTHSNQSVAVVWCHIFGIQQGDFASLMAQLGKVYHLPKEIEAELQRFSDIDHEPFLRWIPELSKAFTEVNYHAPSSIFSEQIKDSILSRIEICSSYLGNRSGEIAISAAELEKLQKSVIKLMEEVTASDLSSELKQFIIDHLRAIDYAIRDYRITGSKPLVKAFENVVGTIVTQPVAKSSSKNFVVQNFWKFVTALKVLLHITINVDQGEDSAPPAIEYSDFVEVQLVESTEHKTNEIGTGGTEPPSAGRQ